MIGRLAVGFILLTAALAGVFLWYTAERAFYEPVVFQPGAEVRLVLLTTNQPEAIPVDDITGIDATSSPIKFRACFTTPLTLETLTATYQPYAPAEPLIAPSFFDCFDAEVIGKALEAGEARAFLSEPDIYNGVDRVVAVFPDGRAYAWHQLNASLKD
ncbi:MAG: histidine kinase [Rhodobacterales bacterium 17-64-5]|nr:MAG: histidine kinase [Rhodobacterales bacterium 12-65-15]OZA07284.1 MAG: histidine kinase [Rhodobacterales bacterium 17-64-5]